MSDRRYRATFRSFGFSGTATIHTLTTSPHRRFTHPFLIKSTHPMTTCVQGETS
jgi:hypothetical protein